MVTPSLPVPIIVTGSGAVAVFQTGFTGDVTTPDPPPGMLNRGYEASSPRQYSHYAAYAVQRHPIRVAPKSAFATTFRGCPGLSGTTIQRTCSTLWRMMIGETLNCVAVQHAVCGWHPFFTRS